MKKVLSIILLLGVTIGMGAQSSGKFTGSLLWKVSGKGLSKPSYILGTHHLANTSFTDSIPGFAEALKSCEQIAGELDMSDPMGMGMKMQQAAMLPSGKTYKEMLTEGEYKTLDEGLKAVLGAGLDQLGMFKPGMISSIYTVTLFAQKNPGINLQSHEAIDSYVQRKAKETNRPAIGLETVEDQIFALFDATPLDQQAKSLACSVQNKEFGIAVMNTLTHYYKTMQLDKMYELSFKNDKDPCPMPEEYSLTINKSRNDKWLAKLPAIMSEKSTFIAVGALHLTGEEGLLFQLDKMGYKIEAVK